jgi:hypothetical protein
MMRCTASWPITSISPSHSARQGLYVIALQQQLRDFIRDATAARLDVKSHPVVVAVQTHKPSVRLAQ